MLATLKTVTIVPSIILSESNELIERRSSPMPDKCISSKSYDHALTILDTDEGAFLRPSCPATG